MSTITSFAFPERILAVETSRFDIVLCGDLGSFVATLDHHGDADGVEYVDLTLVANRPMPPPSISLLWRMPAIDIYSRWHSGATFERGNSVSYGAGVTSQSTSQAPVMSLRSQEGQNRLTFAWSDATNPTTLHAGIHEETACFECSVRPLVGCNTLISRYSARLRLDWRDVPYYRSLSDVSGWWAEMPEYRPAAIPAGARMPVYSTWYAFHQNLDSASVEEQCRLARELGCKTVIVDDGWQNSDTNRGYMSCGDWDVSPSRIADMRAHVEAIHALGMSYMLWYAVPFVGPESRAWSKFQDKFLQVIDIGGPVGVLDPRFPDVRAHLISTYVNAVETWDLDGLKLDFVDSFQALGEAARSTGGGRDIDLVPVAVERLLTDLSARLRKTKPDCMIEFRQGYIGPSMRRFGHMFRAADCPNDALTNRLRTIDIRLLNGNTPVHSDMLMWNERETVEVAALQIINAIFSVPQISVLLNRIPPDHLAMVRWWLSWWMQHRDVLLEGELRPVQPEALYPLVIASTPTKRIAAVYADVVVNPGEGLPADLWLVNGTHAERIIVELRENLGYRRVTVRDCVGHVRRVDDAHIPEGVHIFETPPSGVLHISSSMSAE